MERCFNRYMDAGQLPLRVNLATGQGFWVPCFELAEELIARGALSGRIAVDLKGQYEAWLAALRQAGPTEALLPPQPFSFPEKILIVLPTYNESENLQPIVRSIGRYLTCDILIIDDNSPDGTGKIADALAEASPQIHIMHRSGKLGLASAYLQGFRWALDRGYDLVFEMDSDFSHAPWDLPRLAYAARSADLVMGSRYIAGAGTEDWPLGRRLLSGGGNWYTRLILGRDIHDWTTGFRCYRVSLLRKISAFRVRASGYAFQVELAWLSKTCEATVRELPIRFHDRKQGSSKLGRRTIIEALHTVPRLRIKKAERIGVGS